MKRAAPICAHTHWLRIYGDISAAEVSSKENGVSNPCWAPQPRKPVLGRGAHIIFGCKNQWGFCPSGRAWNLLETRV